jgi:hypothetical protein
LEKKEIASSRELIILGSGAGSSDRTRLGLIGGGGGLNKGLETGLFSSIIRIH